MTPEMEFAQRMEQVSRLSKWVVQTVINQARDLIEELVRIRYAPVMSYLAKGRSYSPESLAHALTADLVGRNGREWHKKIDKGYAIYADVLDAACTEVSPRLLEQLGVERLLIAEALSGEPAPPVPFPYDLSHVDLSTPDADATLLDTTLDMWLAKATPGRAMDAKIIAEQFSFEQLTADDLTGILSLMRQWTVSDDILMALLAEAQDKPAAADLRRAEAVKRTLQRRGFLFEDHDHSYHTVELPDGRRIPAPTFAEEIQEGLERTPGPQDERMVGFGLFDNTKGKRALAAMMVVGLPPEVPNEMFRNLRSELVLSGTPGGEVNHDLQYFRKIFSSRRVHDRLIHVKMLAADTDNPHVSEFGPQRLIAESMEAIARIVSPTNETYVVSEVNHSIGVRRERAGPGRGTETFEEKLIMLPNEASHRVSVAQGMAVFGRRSSSEASMKREFDGIEYSLYPNYNFMCAPLAELLVRSRGLYDGMRLMYGITPPSRPSESRA